MNKNSIYGMVILLAAIVVIAGGLARLSSRNSLNLIEYMEQNATPAPGGESTTAVPSDDATQSEDNTGSDMSAGGSTLSGSNTTSPMPSESTPVPSPAPTAIPSSLTGASLNGDTQLGERIELADGFYYEPISEKLRRYMTGVSYPADGETAESPKITFEELRYLHILHYDFNGSPTEGELICNESIAKDLGEIFYELYRNEYQLERVLLIDEYDGDDNASMEDNNTSCFNYRLAVGGNGLSKHAYGLAVDINPLYNPYITYGPDGSENILPACAQPYANRSSAFPYKIDSEDLCYKLFIQHGFTWGGNWNNSKDYQHFQKSLPAAP